MHRLPQPLPAWAGFVFAGAILIGEIVDTTHNRIPVVSYTLIIVAYAYYLACVFALHRVVEAGSGGWFMNKPWKVVGISIVPLLGLFYAVMWPIELASYLQPNGVKMNGIAAGVCLLISFTLIKVDGMLGFAGVFGVMMYVTRCVSAYRFTKEIAPDFDPISAGA